MKRAYEAAIAVSIEDPRLSLAVRAAIDRAVSRAAEVLTAALREPGPPVVRLRTRRRLAALGEGQLRGALVIVRVTRGNAQRLPGLVATIRDAGAAGVQLVWDGEAPARACVERWVFDVLETARSTPHAAPVVLARSDVPAEALRILVASRSSRKDRS